MGTKRHRNLLREYFDAHARKRAQSGLLPFTQAEWAEFFNGQRPIVSGKRVSKVADSSIARAVSGTPGVARRIGPDRVWMLRAIGLDYGAYIEAWGVGPQGGQR